jgi:hypothetical protein
VNGGATRFLPDRLRPPVRGRRSRRGLVVASVVPILLFALPLWRVGEVRVEGCSKLPSSAVESLHELVGQPALGLDLESIRDGVKAWPGIGAVQVELELPGTVWVRAEEEPALGSVRVGRGWHGVGADGRLTGAAARALEPVLAGFSGSGDRAAGIAAAERLQRATGARVLELRRITPSDFRALLAPSGDRPPAVVHVRPRGSVAEAAWCAAFAEGGVAQSWADLRWSDRMVVGGGR